MPEPLFATKFRLRHLTDATKDIVAEIIIDEEDKRVEWDGLPDSLSMDISKDFYCATNYPIGMLNSALNEQLENFRGTRPLEEIKALITESIDIKTTKVQDDYDYVEKIGEGGYGAVYRVKRKADGRLFALKVLKEV